VPSQQQPARGTIEQRQFERITSTLQIKYYIIEKEYADTLQQDAAYKDTTLESLSKMDRPNTPLQGVTDNISAGGLSLVTDQPVALGTHVVCDITMPNLPRPLRALAEVVRTDSKEGRVVDRTISTYRSGLKIIAINKDDLKRIENYIIEEKIKQRLSGR
jgi:c-di-GMP-binding flagellar brake protein YcgR